MLLIQSSYLHLYLSQDGQIFKAILFCLLYLLHVVIASYWYSSDINQYWSFIVHIVGTQVCGPNFSKTGVTWDYCSLSNLFPNVP
ncbi:hypothetical protein GDO81_018216 [Engystomops pustulosus]|uniref:Uncharacterized protein n=1 Tax=Engystomops pustulosus TaxID=76066 RepID=A0AAV7A5U3_ENGPU|nr:hypothetical protein GDO81_018216 [Engystomops pustulosus]